MAGGAYKFHIHRAYIIYGLAIQQTHQIHQSFRFYIYSRQTFDFVVLGSNVKHPLRAILVVAERSQTTTMLT